MPCMILSGSNNDIVSPPPISGGGDFYTLLEVLPEAF